MLKQALMQGVHTVSTFVLYTGAVVPQSLKQQEEGTLDPQSVTLLTPQQSS